MDEEILRLKALEDVAEAARTWCRYPASPSARRAVDMALTVLDDFEPDSTLVEPVTSTSVPPVVHVRAAVAVAPGGRYMVYGSSDEENDTKFRNFVYARLCHLENCTVHFLEAVVPVSVELRIQCNVSDSADLSEFDEPPSRQERETEPAPSK